MGGENVKLFLSCVSDEFGAYRDELRRKLTRPNVEVKIQEDFKLLGGDTLKMLEDYIAQCEAVVHFVGDMAGSSPAPTTVDDLLTRRPDLAARLADKGMGREALASLTYTQWEAWLAIGFGKDLIIVTPADGVARGPVFRPTDASRASAGAEPETLAGGQPLSRPALHQRRQSGCADFRLGRHRRAREGGGETRRPAAQSAVRVDRSAVRRARHRRSRSCARRSRARHRRLSPLG